MVMNRILYYVKYTPTIYKYLISHDKFFPLGSLIILSITYDFGF